METRKTTTLRLKIRKRLSSLTRGKLHTYFMGFGLLVLLSISNSESVLAQCAMACNKNVQVSIDTSCYMEVLPGMILEGEESRCPNGDFEVIVMEKNTVIPTSPYVGPDHLWKTLTVKVRDRISNNSCWSSIYVEDKQPPIIICENDTMNCNAFPFYEGPEWIERCDTGSVLTKVGETSDPFLCDPEFTKRITQYWVAEDSYGNRSPICTLDIYLRRVDIDSVEMPKDRIEGNDCELACDSIFMKDQNGNPHPEVTGVPLLDSLPLWPDFTEYCNLNVDYSDQILVDKPCKTKILRTWRFVEWWCGQAIVTELPQYIEIIDTEGPEITCPRDWHISTDGGYQCEATIDLPAADVYDVCAGDSVKVDIHYPGGVIKDSNGGRITLPAGDHVIEYIAFDPCYNMSVCTLNIHVADKTPPVTVCDQHTVVTLNQTGDVHLYAETLDDGTFDDCYLDSFAVKRMDESLACMFPDTLFRSYARFCCEDVGDTVMVIFRAWDHYGNFNDCMVEVQVQDKLPPRIYCPDSVMIECTEYLDSLDFSRFGDPTYTDNCNVQITERIIDNTNQCNIGVIERILTARDNGGRQDSCTQRIRVYDPDPFDSTTIVWPLDFTTNSGCTVTDLMPSSLPSPFDRPVFVDDECSLIGVTHEDEIFTFVPDSNACFKIFRTWKIIDWCTFDRQGNYAQYIYQQVLKVNNISPPLIVRGCEEDTICTYDPDCNDGFIELIAEAIDDCTPGEDLIWHLQIDYFDDRIIDKDSAGRGELIDASGDYPIGRHRIKYSFEDLCGNKGTCTTYFEIINCKLPIAYCLNGIAVDLMPQDTNNDGRDDWGMIEIWAEELDLGSFHCNEEITFSFSRDTTDKARMYDCDSLGMRPVNMYVTDRVTGNQTFCSTFVVIQDNNNACPMTMTSQAMIAGIVADDEGREMESVEVEINGARTAMISTNEYGAYAFNGMPTGENYTIQPVLMGDPIDGVSTFDLVEIQRHLLGIDTLTDPYKQIAADVDRNKQLSVKDLLFIRRLILGLEQDFSGQPSWRFVQKQYQFTNPNAPLEENFPEAFEINGLSGNMIYVDFTGIKLGDLNGSYTRLDSELETRSPVELNADIRENTAGSYEVVIRPETAQTLAGVQFTLEYEADRWYWTGDWEAAGQEQGNAAIAEVWPGKISFSWSNPGGNEQPELRLVLAGENAIPNVSLSSEITRAEAYSLEGMEFPLELRGSKAELSTAFEVYPNPFYDMATLRFNLPANEPYTLMITDMAGRSVFSRENMAGEGPDEINIHASDLPGQGIYYAVIRASGVKKVQKMVFIPSR